MLNETGDEGFIDDGDTAEVATMSEYLRTVDMEVVGEEGESELIDDEEAVRTSIYT